MGNFLLFLPSFPPRLSHHRRVAARHRKHGGQHDASQHRLPKVAGQAGAGGRFGWFFFFTILFRNSLYFVLIFPVYYLHRITQPLFSLHHRRRTAPTRLPRVLPLLPRDLRPRPLPPRLLMRAPVRAMMAAVRRVLGLLVQWFFLVSFQHCSLVLLFFFRFGLCFFFFSFSSLSVVSTVL